MTNDERRISIGQRLRECRKAARLTQEDVGLRLDLTPQTVSSWERGKSMPKADQWYGLGPLLGVSLDYLVYGIRTVPEGAAPILRAIFQAPGVEPPAVAFDTPAHRPTF